MGFIDWSRDVGGVSCSAFNYGSPQGLALTDFMALNNITQRNPVPNEDGRVLDLVLTNCTTLEVSNSSNIISKIDRKHPPLLITVPELIPHFLKPARSPRHNFFKANYDLILAHLKEINWSKQFDKCQNVNEMTAVFYCILNDTVERYVPISRPKRSGFPSWFSKSLIQIILEKESKKKKFMKYKNPHDRNPKCFWNFIKDRRGGETTIPAEMTLDDQTANTGTKIAELFAKHFSSVFSNIILPDSLESTVHGLPYLSKIKFGEQEIKRAIKKLDIFKGAGPDEIPPIFVKRCGPTLALPLSILFNRSLHDGVFPELWKKAKIVPVYKKGDNKNVKNYRPVSILSCIFKLFESLVCPIVTRHLESQISEYQHGFRKGRSVQTNLVSFMSYLSKEIDRRQQVDSIYMDFSSAFDKVCHSRLIHKLRRSGVGGTLLEWFKSYLAKRLQFVVLNGHISHEYVACSGVPQGSHLGPVLFSVFINDISSSVHHCKYSLFADDFKIFKTVSSNNDVELIQADLDGINMWCELNGMIINTNKSYHIKYTKKKVQLQSSYKLQSDTLQEVKEIRDLGVIMDTQLKFKVHMDTIVKQAARMLGFLKRNTKGFVSAQTKIMLYNSLVRSKLEFASVVWSPQYTAPSQRLERLQRSFTRYLAYHTSGISHKATYDLRLKHFKMISLHNRRIILDLTFLKKLISGQIACSELLDKINFKVPYRYPRNPITNILVEPIGRTNALKHSSLSRMCSEYNRFSASIKDFDIFHDSSTSLKKKLAVHFCS
ncbi:unnamed protein product [Euphydryas editha]|uniref:Reverse transcriptase domain-containing protein n=1 Tax=Euphydryas editha TaxID=104508 RepID=A0AAU9UWY0_EUPED|nr:unnamed protein product [Euphydryas editha]